MSGKRSDRITRTILCGLLLGGLPLYGCGDDDVPAGDGGVTADAATDGGAPGDGATDGGAAGPVCEGLAMDPPAGMCMALPTDYTPGADDMWAACVSDDGEYHRIEPTISSIARVMAFDQIAALLFDPTADPTPDDFTAARMIYQEDQGIDSRVVRRYDPHFTVPDGTDCSLPGVPDMYPDYCVGPAKLQPILLGAFGSGITGGADPSRVYAARIEAGLLWFFYVSPYKESLTCTDRAKDCDSAYAYYTGGEVARGGIGLSARIRAVDPDAHDRAWDGFLALRCWRELDPAVPATMLDMRDRARHQFDRALLDGVAAIVRSELVQACAGSGPERLYHWELARTLGQALLREAVDRSATDAAALQMELERTSLDDVDVTAAVTAIDALFDCP